MIQVKKKAAAPILWLLLIAACICDTYPSFARAGGGGGGHFGGGGSGGGGYSYGGGGGFGVGGGIGSPLLIIVIIIIVLLINYYKKQNQSRVIGETVAPVPHAASGFPEGLDEQKVAASFMAIQDAWMRKDLTNVRKWISDGMYQRFTTQFNMMNVLAQQNTLTNIRIMRIVPLGKRTDGRYTIAEVAISFSMNDSFASNKYPQFNESYAGDTDTEYWTFIKRTDSPDEKNLYDNNSCPNCGAPFEVKMGEISRCSNCNTLTNSAAYDWVLSEIIQSDTYDSRRLSADYSPLQGLLKDDPFFSVQRMEDIASNVFMQVMEAWTIADKKRLGRFADEQTMQGIMAQKKQTPAFVFDRLYLDDVKLSRYHAENGIIKLYFDMDATYRRATIDGKLHMLDDKFVTTHFYLELSRVQEMAAKAETVYSYECSNCGAPYTDTTQDRCTYCDAPVVDIKRNWVLTAFGWNR